MKKLLFIFYLISVCGFSQTTYTTTSNLNLREKSNVNSRILETINANDKVSVDSLGSEWSKITSQTGNIGYVKTEFLKEQKQSKKEKEKILHHGYMKIFLVILLAYIIMLVYGRITKKNSYNRKKKEIEANAKITVYDDREEDISDLEIKKQNFSKLQEKLYNNIEELYGWETLENFKKGKKIWKGMPDVLVSVFFGEPHDVIERKTPDIVYKTFVYDPISGARSNARIEDKYRTVIYSQNGIINHWNMLT
ncbi:MAG: SH3 domain-containing protein [Flavobacteriaceae bacterium]|nr:SH3 domain-containing protein [Flavobacteriaceae bacterium]